jgi:heme/copper-type cytochrome/quinol oxidase subunit 2
MTPDMTAGSASLTKPLLAFGGLLILGQVLLTILASYVEMPSSIGIVILMAAGMAGGQTFGNTARRLMTKAERFKFAIAGTIAAIVIGFAGLYATFAYYAVPFSFENFALGMGIPAGEVADFRSFMAIGLVIGLLVSLIVLYFAAGFGSRTSVKQLEKQGKL